MKIMRKKLTRILVSTFLILSSVFCVSGAIDTQLLRWSYISTIEGNIDISSSGTATVLAGGSAASSDVNKTVLTLDLQQFVGGKWQTKKEWTTTSFSNIIRSGECSWQVAHGYSYQLYITLKAYNSTKLLETATHTVSYGYFR